MKPPKRWKMAIVIWLAIYPLITTVFAVLIFVYLGISCSAVLVCCRVVDVRPEVG